MFLQAVTETPVVEEVPEKEESQEAEAVEEEKPDSEETAPASQAASSEPEEPENLRKIFAGGLNRETSDESFKEFFSQFGEITDGVVIKDHVQGG